MCTAEVDGLRRTSVDPIAISPQLSNSNNVQTPPLSFSQVSSRRLPSVASSQAGPGFAAPGPAPSSVNTGNYSRGQLMGKFSIRDRNTHVQPYNPGVTSCSMDNEGFDLDRVDLNADFMEPPPLDMEFLFDEADMINNHLLEVFPPMEFQSPTPYDESLGYSGIQMATSLAESVAPEALRDMQAGMASRLGDNTATQTQVFGCGTTQSGQRRHERNDVGSSLDNIDEAATNNPWDVSEAAYERLSAEFLNHQDPSDPFFLPSRRTISRYVASWIRSFNPHLPFIHLPTNCFDRKSPMLLLTLAAAGSFYGFEHSHGYPMCFVAKAVVTKKLEDRRRASSMHLLKSFPRYAEVPRKTSKATAQSVPPRQETSIDIELLQCILILVMSMTWLDEPLIRDALALSSQLTELTREALKNPTLHVTMNVWEDWAHEEERRRTIFSAYFTLNMLTICFKVPPQITGTEIILPLPSSEAAFKAPNTDAWKLLQQADNHSPLLFHECVKQLLHGVPLPKTGPTTEFGNYMLMQSLLTQVYSERQTASCLLNSSLNLQPATITLYDAAFNAWQSCWGSAIDSAIDPSSSHGPLAFNSTAMLRLAHILLAVDLQGHYTLRERDPQVLAQAFEPEQNPIPLRLPHLDQAVLHAIHALKIPIRVGIAFVARGRTGHWSIQHAISNFTCALLLTHWFENLFRLASANGINGLRQEEKYLLSMVERLIEETYLEDSLGESNEYPFRIRRLAIAALKLWADTCKGVQIFEMIYVIGETLSIVAHSLEKHHGN